MRLAALLVLALVGASRADAGCNLIPGVARSFDGARGALDRPFAGPGDFIDVRLRPACAEPAAGFGGAPGDFVVSVVFTPPGAPRHLVAVAEDCAALAPELARCAGRASLAGATCVPANVASPTGQLGTSIEVLDAQRLRLRFPDTDALLDAPDDGRTLAGPAAIAVTRRGAPLPCELAEEPCAALDETVACVDALYESDGTCGSQPHALFSHFTALPPSNDYRALCVDPAPPCTGTATEVRFAVDADGNALIPMDWFGVLLGRAVPIARLLHATASLEAFADDPRAVQVPSSAFLRSFSPEGGALPPVFEPQADPSAADRLTVFGSTDALRTVLRVGRRSPDLTQCSGGDRDGLPCAASADCPAGTCASGRCVGGASADSQCRADGECPDGTCGRGLFDFGSRMLAGVGPVVVPRFGPGTCQASGTACLDDFDCGGDDRCVRYRLEARDPVPLEALIESPSIFVTVVPEAIQGRDLNGDGDMTDNVLLLADRRTGVRRAIGSAAAAGRAATRINQQPFSYPAVAVEGDVVAFLEAEPLQGGTDANGDDDQFDTILRVYRNDAEGAVDVLTGAAIVADAAPVIGGRSLAVSDGLVFLRTAEAATARRRLSLASVTAGGASGDGPSTEPRLSADGQHVAFESRATDLDAVVRPDDEAADDRPRAVHVRNRAAATTHRLDPGDVLAPPIGDASAPAISADGRFVAFVGAQGTARSQVLVSDRDPDANGILDEAPTAPATVVSRGPDDVPGDKLSAFPVLSADGRFVLYVSNARNLVEQPPLADNLLLQDRDADGNGIFDEAGGVTTEIVSVNSRGIPVDFDTYREAAALSADGRTAFWASNDPGIVPDDTNDHCLVFLPRFAVNCLDVFARDRALGATTRISTSSLGGEGSGPSFAPAVSADGRIVAFLSAADSLVPGDTNGVVDVFVHDRQSGTTDRVSVASDGREGNALSFDTRLAVSADGRYIAFTSAATNLTRDPVATGCDSDGDGQRDDACSNVYVHDELTGFTARLSRTSNGGAADGAVRAVSLSADGATAAFESRAANLVPGDDNPFCDNDFDGVAAEDCADIVISEPDPSSALDINADGDIDDTVLQVIDTRGGGAPLALAPATMVAVSDGDAAFLVPEREAGADLDGDGDRDDAVVHLYRNRAPGPPQSLGRPATAVALSHGWLAALVQVGPGTDGVTEVQVHRVGDPPDRWTATGLLADAVGIAGSRVVAIAPEAWAGRDLNGDGDRDDRVLHLIDPASGAVRSLATAAEEFVVSDTLVAFRTSEAAEGGHSLNGDADALDGVLRIYDLASDTLIETGQAVFPCRLEACDPRQPYRVLRDTVRFLTLEADQDEDLNADGDRADLLVQTYNVRVASRPAAAALRHGRSLRTAVRAEAVFAAPVTTLGAVSTGICSVDGRACTTARDCPAGGTCFVPPGGCVLDLGTRCTTGLVSTGCGAGEFCVPGTEPGEGTCHVKQGACSTDADCGAPARCRDAAQAVQQVVDPLEPSSGGGLVFVGAGRCNEDLGIACTPEHPQCAAGYACTAVPSTQRFSCQRAYGACEGDGDCPTGTACRRDLVLSVAADSDGDEIADPFDNCPLAANAAQDDRDADGVGDACEVVPPTATPVPAPPHGDSDDGCAIGAPTHASTWMPFALAVALLLAMRRRARPAPARPPTPTPRSPQ